jgi:iron-sulfur cluster assembly protein
VIVDDASLKYVNGSTVDYKESMMGAGFEVNNPNVVAACGCGSSFRVADEDPSCGAPA